VEPIAEMVDAASNINLWNEWAIDALAKEKIQITKG
jgi:hypothetical protein